MDYTANTSTIKCVDEMSNLLIFISGAIVTTALFAYFDPLCGLSSWLIGFGCGVVLLGVTMFIGGAIKG